MRWFCLSREGGSRLHSFGDPVREVVRQMFGGIVEGSGPHPLLLSIYRCMSMMSGAHPAQRLSEALRILWGR